MQELTGYQQDTIDVVMDVDVLPKTVPVKYYQRVGRGNRLGPIKLDVEDAHNRSRMDVPDYYVQLGKNIRKARTNQALSQETCGELLGVSFQQMQKYEYGINRCPIDKLHKFAKICEVTLDSLLPE